MGQNTLFFNKKKYDFVFGIGEACSCSSTLRSANLQIKSLPFDWIAGSDFTKRVDMIVNGFQDFIKKESLVCIGDNGIPSHLCDIYKNKENHLIFNHDFLSGKDFDEEYKNVHEKYIRRAERLFKNINNSEKLLAVWISTPGAARIESSDEDYINGYNVLCKKFPSKKLDLLVFNYEKGLSFGNRKYERITDNIEKYTFDYHKAFHKGKPLADYVVDEKMLKKILKKYELKMTLKEKWDNYIFKKQH